MAYECIKYWMCWLLASLLVATWTAKHSLVEMFVQPFPIWIRTQSSTNIRYLSRMLHFAECRRYFSSPWQYVNENISQNIISTELFKMKDYDLVLHLLEGLSFFDRIRHIYIYIKNNFAYLPPSLISALFYFFVSFTESELYTWPLLEWFLPLRK